MPKRKAEATHEYVEEDGYNYISRAEQHKDIIDEIRAGSRMKYNLPQLAPYFGCTAQALRNKFSRGSFTLDEVILMMFLGGLSLTIYDSKGEWVNDFDPGTYVHNDKEMWYRYRDQKRKEYEEYKAKAQSLQDQFGFDEEKPEET